MSPAGSYARKVRTPADGLWKDRRPALSRLDVELTERCNFSCPHCSVGLSAGDAAAGAKELDAKAVSAVLEEASALGCLVVRLTGGEPLLRPDFEDIYLAARRLGLRVMLFTNAALLTERTADFLAKYPPLERIEVTIYGMSAASARAATGNAKAFAGAMRGLKLLEARHLPFIVKGAVLPANKKELAGFEKWAAALAWMEGAKPSLVTAYDLRSARDSEERNVAIRALRPAPEWIVRHEAGRDPGLLEFRSFVAGRHERHGARLFLCHPTGAAALDPYGRLRYCLSLRHPAAVYDLGKGSLAEAVREFLPEVGRMRASSPAYLGRCGDCFLREACLQCPAKSWAEYGTLDSPVEYLCRLTHLKAEAAGLLEPGEKAWKAVAGRLFAGANTGDNGTGCGSAACPEHREENHNG